MARKRVGSNVCLDGVAGSLVRNPASMICKGTIDLITNSVPVNEKGSRGSPQESSDSGA